MLFLGNTSADQDAPIKDSATPSATPERNFMRGSERDGTQTSWVVTSTPKSSMPVSCGQVDLTFRRSSKKKKKRGRNPENNINIDIDKDERKANTSQQESVNFEDSVMTRSKRKEDQVVIVLAQMENDNREESNKKKSKKRKSNKIADAAEDADVTSNQQAEISNVTFEEAHENGTPGDIEENGKKKTKKRKQKMLSDNRIPPEGANNTADQEGILKVTSEVSNLERHKGVALEDNVDNRRKGKRKTRNSSEKRMNVEDKTGNVEKNKDQQETKGGKDILEEGESETSARENGTPGDIEENSKRKTKKRKQKLLSDNRIPTEDANNTADQEGILEVTSEVSNLEGHEGVASEDNVDNQRRDKRKKRNSSEKRMSVEDKTGNIEKNNDQQETKDGKDILDILEEDTETSVADKVALENQNDDEDVIIIEQGKLI